MDQIDGLPGARDAGASAASSSAPRSAFTRTRIALSATVAAVLGLLPHVLHHAGPLAGAALFAGAAGSLLFAALGFIAAIPMLLRLHRRFDTWRAPAIALAVFAAVFALSTFVIGPAITGGGSDGSAGRQDTPSDSGHDSHHP